MKLTLQRQTPKASCTLGALAIDGEYECVTLEPGHASAKGPVPAGIYELVLDHSHKLDYVCPHILEVPGFIGIRIHIGNWPRETEGCQLVGQFVDGDGEMVRSSTLAFNGLMNKLRPVFMRKEKITITICDGVY